MIFDAKTGPAYEQYVQSLSDAITNRDWIYDPSYALGADAEVYSKIMRDPVAAHAIRFRKHLVAGLEWVVEPASEAPQDQQAAAIVEEALEKIQGFMDARIRLGSSIFFGSSYAFVSGKRQFTSLAGGMPEAWWVPTKLIDVDRRRFRLVRWRGDGRLHWEFHSAERNRWELLEHPEWFIRSVFDETEDSLGYGRGLLDTLYYYQSAKARVLQDALAASERFGQGFLKAKIENLRGAGPDRAGTTLVNEWQTELRKHRARNILVHDARDEVEILSGFGEGWQLLKELLSYLDANQVMCVLGSTLSTMQSLGEVGSNAKAIEHANSVEALVQADRARLSDDLTRDLIGLFWSLNGFAIQAQAGFDARMPSLKIVQQKREDQKEATDIVAALLDRGVPLRADEVYSRTGFTAPKPGDALVEASPKPDPAAGGFGGPPQPMGGFGFSSEQVGELKALLAQAGGYVDLRNGRNAA